MATVYRKKIFCETDSKWEYVWEDNDSEPTSCPVDGAHTVTAGSGGIDSKVSDQSLDIKQETIETGNNAGFISLDVSVGTTIQDYVQDFTFPIDINMLRGSFEDCPDYGGDHVALHVSPDTVIGTITSAVAVDDTVISVAQSVVDTVEVGYWVEVDGEDLGRVTAINNGGLTITVETPATATHDSGTLVKMTVKMVSKITMTGGQAGIILDGGIKASYLPAGTVIRVIYSNTTGGTARTFSPILDYLY